MPDSSGLNVVLITADDLGYNTPGMMGNPMPEITPNLDAMAAGGVVFTHCFGTTPICGPARNSIFTGQYPHVNAFMGYFMSIPAWWKELKGDPERTTYLTGVSGKHGSS